MVVFPPVADQLAIIRRGVEKIVPEEELATKLEKSRQTGTPLRVKYGIDPTGIDVHLGHTVPLRKLRQFQELGHQAVIIIGNYTALVGDPSGRDQARSKRLTTDEVEANAQDYLAQVGKVIDLSKAEIHRNGDWFAKMSFSDILGLCGRVTVAQLLTRDDFAKRYAAAVPIYLHECLYPVMQAWDSVEIRADIELGGTEQLYSFMLARDLQSMQGLNQQIGVMSPILVGLDGVRRMGKSLGNYIGIGESAYEMMKKFMQLPDAVLPMYFELLTTVPLPDVQAILTGHPKEAKIRLATEVIGFYYGAEAGVEAANRWQNEVSGGALPEEIAEFVVVSGQPNLSATNEMLIGHLLVSSGVCSSSSEAIRKIGEGAVYIIEGGQKVKIEDRKSAVRLVDGLIFGVGKKQIRRVRFADSPVV